MREALERIGNASYTELRPVVEHYSHDPAATSVMYPNAAVHRSHATEAEWALARKVAAWFQTVAIEALNALAAQPDPSRVPASVEALANRVRAILTERASDLTKEASDECEQCGQLVMCSYHSLLSELAGHVGLASSLSGSSQSQPEGWQDKEKP